MTISPVPRRLPSIATWSTSFSRTASPWDSSTWTEQASEQGSWIGFGKWKPMPRAKPTSTQVAKIDADDDAQSDAPTLHRKHHGGDASSGTGGASGGSTNGTGNGPGNGSGNGSGPDPSAPPPDPDRPTLHKSGDTSESSAGDNSTGGNSSTSSGSGASPGNASANDSDRPKLKKTRSDDEGYVSDVATLSDPDRPHLFRGKSAGFNAPVTPSMVGMPPEMQQEVAVSDATDRPEHLWNYTWANPEDEAKMKAAMEELARTALRLNPPAAPAKSTHKSASKSHKPAQPAHRPSRRRFATSSSASSSWPTARAPPWCSPRTPRAPAPRRNSSP